MTTSNDRAGLACEAAGAEIRTFLAGAGGAQSPELRAHLVSCRDCAALYRENVVAMARIASGARLAAEVRHADDLAASARRSLIAAETRHRLRIPRSLLPLAIVALVAILVSKTGSPRVSLHALAGTVYRGTERVAPGERVVSANGDGCSVGSDGAAELARGADAIRFEANASFTIERLDRLAIRLFDGRADVTGSALVVLQNGVLEVSAGRARIAVGDGGATIEALADKVEFTDARGRNAIAPGTTRRLAPAHAVGGS